MQNFNIDIPVVSTNLPASILYGNCCSNNCTMSLQLSLVLYSLMDAKSDTVSAYIVTISKKFIQSQCN